MTKPDFSKEAQKFVHTIQHWRRYRWSGDVDWACLEDILATLLTRIATAAYERGCQEQHERMIAFMTDATLPKEKP